ncbi:Mu-like prophage major head subunit gpT family protein [Erythrobacter colymbi]|uniref:Mu-like prophage major head subunit gpT family protein n=1 Tax=Erythrobacter colymbi TaxID=1161202 RepID=UPI000A35D81C|nr:Mu-like prophage major head subunit gpT family protein [Erythrobacter colymbi]
MQVTIATLEALRTGFKRDFQNGLTKATPQYEAFSTPVTSTTKLETYGFLGDFPIFREWIGEKRIKSMEEKAYQLINRDFEVTRGIHKNKIRDDNLGLYGPLVNGWGDSSGQLKDRLAFEALKDGHVRPCYDGQNYFDTDHPVGNGVVSNMSGDNSRDPWYLIDASQALKPILLQTRQEPTFDMIVDPQSDHVFKTGEFLMGAEARAAAGYTFWQLAHRCTGPINEANYVAACQAMESITDDEGEPLGIKPTHIIVGKSNKSAARNLFKKMNLAGGESNIYFEDVVILEARRLP